jgi:tetratricopeptide (TPR) repeat protein
MTQAQTARADPEMTLAYTLANRGLNLAAIDLAAQMAVSSPGRASAWALIGCLGKSRLCLSRALTIAPDHVDALTDLASMESGDRARNLYERALHAEPGYLPALTNFGLWLQNQGHAADAQIPLSACLVLEPGNAQFLSNLAAARMSAGYPNHGARLATHSLVIHPDLAAAHYNLGMCQLMVGDLIPGFVGHEWRFEAGAVGPPLLSGPRWQGDIQTSATLAIHAEQGLGDSLLFARFVALARARVGRVILVVQPQLKRCFSKLEGVDLVLAVGEPVPPYDLQCPLMSLPYAMAIDLAHLPPPPKITIDQPAFDKFSARLAALPGLKVGLVWQGNPAFPGDPTRSIPLEALAPLARIKGVTWISLQMGADHARAGIGPNMVDWMGDIRDLSETAALIQNLDLVIAVDTMLGHLTGALGQPVWIMNRFNTCWRWFLAREDSPWYPGLRLFRQAQPGNWDAVVNRVAEALIQRIG